MKTCPVWSCGVRATGNGLWEGIEDWGPRGISTTCPLNFGVSPAFDIEALPESTNEQEMGTSCEDTEVSSEDVSSGRDAAGNHYDAEQFMADFGRSNTFHAARTPANDDIYYSRKSRLTLLALDGSQDRLGLYLLVEISATINSTTL